MTPALIFSVKGLWQHLSSKVKWFFDEMTSTIWQILSSTPNSYSRNANLTPFLTCKLSCIDQTNWLPNLSHIQMGPTPTWVTFVWLYKSDGLPAAAKALCLLPQQCLPRHSSPSATLQCWANWYISTHFNISSNQIKWNVMPNRTFYNSVQFSALVTLNWVWLQFIALER